MPVQEVLTRRLRLEAAEFQLEDVGGGKLSGLVISASFRGMSDSERQRKMWDALDAEYGAESVQRVGSLLAFTPEEWELDSAPAVRR